MFEIGEPGFSVKVTFDERRLKFVTSSNNGHIYATSFYPDDGSSPVNTSGSPNNSTDLLAFDNGRWMIYGKNGIVHGYTDEPPLPVRFHYGFDRPILDAKEWK